MSTAAIINEYQITTGPLSTLELMLTTMIPLEAELRRLRLQQATTDNKYLNALQNQKALHKGTKVRLETINRDYETNKETTTDITILINQLENNENIDMGKPYPVYNTYDAIHVIL